MTEPITTEEFDQRFDDGEDLSSFVDWDRATWWVPPAKRSDKPRHLQITLPDWLLRLLDDEASRRCVSRKAVINDWLVDRADQELARRAAAASVPTSVSEG